MAGGTLLVTQFFVLFLVKMVTSPDFRRRGHYTNKLLHLIENTNIATPFCDWDEGEYSVQEYKKRFRSTIKEMVATFIVNTIVTGVMMVPLWFTGNPILSRLIPTIIYFLFKFKVHQIEKRHHLLQKLFGVVKPEETKSFEDAIFYRAALTASICTLVILEGASYFLYLFLVFA